MALELNIASMATFDGNRYPIPLDLIMSDRSYQEFEYNDPGLNASLSTAVNRIIDSFGFNPFSKIKYYSTNRQPNVTEVDQVVQSCLNAFGINHQVILSSAGGERFTDFTVNDVPIYNRGSAPGMIESQSQIYCYSSLSIYSLLVYRTSETTVSISYTLFFPSEHFYDHGEFDIRNIYGNSVGGQIRLVFNESTFKWGVEFQAQGVTHNTMPSGLDVTFTDIINAHPEDITYQNPSDPFDTGSPSTPAGGDGDYQNAEKSDPIDFPDLPDIDAVSSGLITIYAPSLAQIQSLGDYLWSDLFDINTLKKLFADPMSALIGLGIVPVTPTLAGSKTVKFGNTSTGVVMPYVASQFVTKEMGSVKVSKYVGSFMDFDYTQVQIYLPYIGIRNLDVHDVMGCTLTLKYQIDVLTGGCAAMISVSGKGVLYQFNGSCIANVPLTANNYSTAIQNAISSVISGGATIAGALTGAAPLTVAGVAGLATSAANTAVSAKSPSIERSGSMGGAAGLLAVQQPYVIIERPNFSIPKNLNRYTGNMLNVTMNLATAVGFTMIDYIHLDNIPCTESEREELLSILKQGVIF